MAQIHQLGRFGIEFSKAYMSQKKVMRAAVGKLYFPYIYFETSPDIKYCNLLAHIYLATEK